MKSKIQRLYLFIIYFLLYFPILILVIFSVNKTKYSLVWHGFSSQWYQVLLNDVEIWSAFFNSAVLGITASCIATGLGLLGCMHLFIHPHKKFRSLRNLLLLLIIIPDIVLGISLLVFFNVTNLPLGFVSLLIAHITFCLPFVILTIESRLQTLDPNLYFCALDLGASQMAALSKIFLPLLWPAILSAALLSFTISFDDVVTSYFVSGSDFSILPLTIYSLVRSGVTPELNALCTITLIISIIPILIVHKLTRKKT